MTIKKFDCIGKALPAPPGRVVHEYRAWGTGLPIVVQRDSKGRFLSRHRMAETRDPSKLGGPVKHPKSALLRSLGLPVNPWQKRRGDRDE